METAETVGYHIRTMPQLLPFDLPGGPLVALLFGLSLLLAGRRIFWLVVGVFGFLFAYQLAERYLGAQTEGLELIVAVLAGLAGIVLAIFLQRVAVGLAGFLFGCYVAIGTVSGSGSVSAPGLVLVLIAGVLCSVLALWLFETALIVLSSLVGAALISEGLHLEPNTSLLAFVILVIVGIAVQAGIGPRRRRRRRHRDDD